MTTPSIRMEPNGPLARARPIRDPVRTPHREGKPRRVGFVSRPPFVPEEEESR